MSSMQVEIIPFLVAIFLIQLPTYIRRYFDVWYGPVYFSVFPLASLNENLGEYFAEEFFVGNLENLNSDELEKNIRKKAILLGVKSLIAATVISPLICAFICAFFLRPEDVIWVLTAAILMKIPGFLKSISDFKVHAIANRKNLFLLSLIYFIYCGVYWVAFQSSYEWAQPFIIAEKYFDMFKALGDLLFKQLIWQSIIVAVPVAIIMNLILEKDVRKRNIESLQSKNS